MPKIERDVTPPRETASTSAWLNATTLTIGTFLMFALIGLFAIAWNFRSRKSVESKTIPMRTVGAAGPITVLKPSHNLLGTVRLTETESANIVVEADGADDEYFETVVYHYPEMSHVYAVANSPCTNLDFLPEGKYAIVVFSIKNLNCHVEMCRNASLGKRETFVNKTEISEDPELEKAIVSNLFKHEVDTVDARKVQIHPPPVLTHVVTFEDVCEDSDEEVIVSMPTTSFCKSEIARDSLVYERGNTSFFKISSRCAKNSTVVHPNVNPEDSPPRTVVYRPIKHGS